MDLRQFIYNALQQIISGVADAQKAISAQGDVNPRIWNAQRGDVAKMKILESNAGKWIHLLDFDVAVSVAKDTGSRGGVGLIVWPVV